MLLDGAEKVIAANAHQLGGRLYSGMVGTSAIDNWGKMSLVAFYKKLSDRAIRLLDIKEGRNTIYVNDSLPKFDGLWSTPIYGSVFSVVAQLFAVKYMVQKKSLVRRVFVKPYPNATKNALEKIGPSFARAKELKDSGDHIESIKRMGGIYFSGALFVVSDLRKYCEAVRMADPHEMYFYERWRESPRSYSSDHDPTLKLISFYNQKNDW